MNNRGAEREIRACTQEFHDLQVYQRLPKGSIGFVETSTGLNDLVGVSASSPLAGVACIGIGDERIKELSVLTNWQI